MKTLLLLLFPVLILAQTPNYPDTLFSKSAPPIPCFVTGLDESRLAFIYNDGRTNSALWEKLNRVHIGGLGLVYTTGDGFLFELAEIKSALHTPPAQLTEAPAEIQFSESQAAPTKPAETENRWSLGILMLPSDMEATYTEYEFYDYDSFYLYTRTSRYLPKYEAQLTYRITDQFALTLNSGYSSQYVKSRYEHFSDDKDGDYDSDSGQETTNSLSLFKFDIGIKYYLKPVISKKVSPFVTLSLGKQIASAIDEEKELYDETPPEYPVISDYEKFLEQINSPLLLSAGFGAEYFVNESLSFTTNFKVTYDIIKAKFTTVQENDDYKTTNKYTKKSSEFITLVGVGLHLHF